jgi:hypothetical protein
VSAEERREAHPSDALVDAPALARKEVHPLFNIGRARVTLDAPAGQVTLHDVEVERLDTVLVERGQGSYPDVGLHVPPPTEFHVVLVGKMLQHEDNAFSALTYTTREAADVPVPRGLLDRLEARLRRCLAGTRPGGTPDREDMELVDALVDLRGK